MKRWDKRRVETYQLFIKRYWEFTDAFFTGKTNKLMKQKMIIQTCVYWFASYYCHPLSGYSSKEAIKSLKGHFKSEPFKSAIKKFPLTALRIEQSFFLLLLRAGFVREWLYLNGLMKRILYRNEPKLMYE